MKKLEHYRKKALEGGATKGLIINTDTVVVENWVRLKCQYGCGGYHNYMTCPPYSPTPEYMKKMLSEYTKGLLIQFEHILPEEEKKVALALKKMVPALEREIFLDGYYKAFGIASGPCRFCRTCDTTHPCKFPELARPSMEACGIDVYQTARNNGLKLEVVRTEDSECSYLSLILIC
jgi:predicted metal-binding protein